VDGCLPPVKPTIVAKKSEDVNRLGIDIRGRKHVCGGRTLSMPPIRKAWRIPCFG
jgi:hypothetical protein